jgi:AraC family ethanolamine operon transcriptional activator
MSWFGHRVESEALLAFPNHGEIAVVSRPGFSETTFSVCIEEMAEFIDRSGGPALDDVLAPRETVIQAPPRLLQQLRQHLRQVSVAAGDPTRFSHLLEGFRWRLFSILLEIFRSSTGRWPESIPLRNRRLLEKAAEMVDTLSDDPVGLADLCVAAQVPERTLINTFKRELGITPKAYIKGHRLFRVHRELWRADPSATRVSDVANAWGFWHMGQFAADYRKLFGELPSETLKRSS